MASKHPIAASNSETKDTKKKLNCCHSKSVLKCFTIFSKSGKPSISQKCFTNHQLIPQISKKLIRLKTGKGHIAWSTMPAVGLSPWISCGRKHQVRSSKRNKIGGSSDFKLKAVGYIPFPASANCTFDESIIV
jgi:hypothetical protein